MGKYYNGTLLIYEEHEWGNADQEIWEVSPERRQKAHLSGKGLIRPSEQNACLLSVFLFLLLFFNSEE